MPAAGELTDLAGLAVVGVPDRRWGEVITAVVVLSDAAAPPTLEQLRTHADAPVARLKLVAVQP